MKIPEEFKRLCSQFQMASLVYHGTPEGMIASGLKRINQADRENIKKFLVDLLSNENDVKRIKEAWQQTSSNFYLSSDRELVIFIKKVLDLIEIDHK